MITSSVNHLCVDLTRVLRTLALLVMVGVAATVAQDRFPQPEFTDGYQLPSTHYPAPRAMGWEYVDTAILALALGLAAWLALRRRSRRGIVALMLGCLLYFGFFRKGCICPIGAIQNVSLGLWDPSIGVAPVVVLFFGLPLLFALLFGRVFCSSVCPLGGIQDLVVRTPRQLPVWIDRPLQLLPYLFLGMAVLYPILGFGFVVCRLDPFVGIFRLSAPAPMALAGAAVLLIGVFVARPYCRFLCPYGVLLGWMSRLSRRHVTITPNECVNCRLCQASCPFGAILTPHTTAVAEPPKRSRTRLYVYAALLPLWVALGALGGYSAGGALSHIHPQVRLARQIEREERGEAADLSVESTAYRSGTEPIAALLAQAVLLRGASRRGIMILGGWFGAITGLTLLQLSLQHPRTSHEPDRRTCLSCARCFRSCPQEHKRLRKPGGSDEVG